MPKRPRRWHPGRGFRRVQDAGHMAIWMRLEPDQTVTAVVYLQGSGPGYDGIWTFSDARGGRGLYNITDKPHRVRWLWQDNDDRHYGVPVSYQPIPASWPLRRPPKLRGNAWGKYVQPRWIKRPHPGEWMPWGYRDSLPRKFRDPREGRHA